VPGEEYREHKEGAKGTAQAKDRANGIILYRLFLGQVVKTKKNRRSKSQNQP
jgi:hypothetical protein